MFWGAAGLTGILAGEGRETNDIDAQPMLCGSNSR